MADQSLARETARVGGDASHSRSMPPQEGLSPPVPACPVFVGAAAASFGSKSSTHRIQSPLAESDC
jgi:hypothetical protein